MPNPFRRNWHIISLAAATLIVIIVGILSDLDWIEYNQNAVSARQARDVAERVQSLLALVKDAETSQRGFLLTADPEYLALYLTSLPSTDKSLKDLVDPGSPLSSLPEAPRLHTLIADKLHELGQTIDLARRGETQAALALVRTDHGKRTMDEIRAVATRMIDGAYKENADKAAVARSHAARTRSIVIVGTVLMAILLIGANIHIQRLVRSQEEAKTRFETTLQGIGDAVIATDSTGHVQFMNPIAVSLTGWHLEDASDRPLTEVFRVVNEDSGEPVEDPASKVRQLGVVVGLANHTLLVAKDGSRIPIDDSGAPIRDHHGAMTGIVVVFRDVSAKRQTQRELEASERLYRLLFENNPLPMWVYEIGSLRFLEVNRSAIEHYGYSREEFLAMTLLDIRPAEDVPELLRETESTSRVRFAGGPRRHRKKDGSIIYVEITAHPLAFQGHDASLILAHDVTQRAQLEQQLRQSQKLEAVGHLAGGVAHDFNNMLTVISGYAELLAESIPADDRSRVEERLAVTEIAGAAQRATHLTRQLLAFSRRQILQPQVLNLNTCVANIQKMLSRLLGEDIEIRTVLAEDIWNVSADPGQVDQILLNLALNARDHGQWGHPHH